MHPILDRILTFNLIGTTMVFYVAARIYLLPRLGELAPRSVLVPILLLHSPAPRTHVPGPGDDRSLDASAVRLSRRVPGLLVTHYVTFIILMKHRALISS